MEQDILNRLTKDFGDRGARAAQFLKTAETLVQTPSSAPRIGEAVAYCIRESLVEIPRAANIEEGEWKRLSRYVVDARTRFDLSRGLSGMDEQQALQDLLRSIDDLAAFHKQDNIHLSGLREIIKSRTGVDPLEHNANALNEYQKLINHVNGIVHAPASNTPISIEAAGACLQRAIDVLSKLFLVDSRIGRIQDLSSLETPTEFDVQDLSSILITPHDLRLFASFVTSPIWLDLMLDNGLIEPPDDLNQVWCLPVMISRLKIDHGESIEPWLQKAWSRWSSTEKGLIAVATAAHEAGIPGRNILLQCLRRRPDLPQICFVAGWEFDDMDPSDPYVYEFANILLNPTVDYDQYGKERILEKLVTGMDSINGLDRIRLLSYKLSGQIEIESFFYLEETISIADPNIHFLNEMIRTLTVALINALRKATEIQTPTRDLLRTVDGLPLEIKSHLQAWIRSVSIDNDCQDDVEFIEKGIRERRPTTDDLLLIDVILEKCGSTLGVELWRSALGIPPDPVALGTLLGQPPVPEDIVRRWFWSVILPEEATYAWTTAKNILNSALGETERTYFLRPSNRVTTFSGPNSPFTDGDLESKSPTEVAALIAAWKPTPDDSWNLLSARGIGRQLEALVKKNPRIWADSPVDLVARLRHPTYIAHYFAGLKDDPEALSEVANEVIDSIGFARTYPWPVESLGRDDFEADADWNSTDRSGVDLIKSLANKHIPLTEPASKRAWDIVLESARNKGESSHILGDETDPLHAAINRSCTQALDAILALIEYERRRSGVIPPEALVVLTESLMIEGRDGIEHRAILSSRIPFLRFTLPDWFESNSELLMGREAPPGLAQETIDLWLKWGSPDEWMLTRYRTQILDSVKRGSSRALEGFLQGMFWSIPEYDVASCVKDLVSLGPKNLSMCGESVARMVSSERTPPELVLVGINLWEEVLRASPGKESLRGFGWWAEVPTINSDQWESLTLETCNQTDGDIEWARAVAKRASNNPKSEKALKILGYLVLAPLERRDARRVAEYALEALAESSTDPVFSEVKDELRRALLERGYFEANDS